MSINGTWWYAFLATGRWVGFRLDVIATAALAGGALLAMAIRARVSQAADLAGTRRPVVLREAPKVAYKCCSLCCAPLPCGLLTPPVTPFVEASSSSCVGLGY